MDVTAIGPNNVVVLVTDTDGAVVRAAQVALSLTTALGTVTFPLETDMDGTESNEQLNTPDMETFVLWITGHDTEFIVVDEARDAFWASCRVWVTRDDELKTDVVVTTEGVTRVEVLSVVAWVNVEEFKRGTRISVVALTKVETESRVATEALTVEVDDTTDTKGE